jgi:hypothetical protein
VTLTETQAALYARATRAADLRRPRAAVSSLRQLAKASVAALLASAVPARVLAAHELRVAGAVLEVEIEAVPPALPLPTLLGFIERTAKAVGIYYGGFPVPRAAIEIELGPGRRGFGHGNARYARLPRIRLVLGSETEPEDLRRDWVLAHELVHLGFPSVEESHHWMEEGLATYVEPIARVRAGELPVAKVWGDLVEGLPKGLPMAGDRGLDHTRTWGRTYWGGALFWLLADVEIRARTGNRRGLEDALRAVVRSGGTLGHYREVGDVIAVGDGATGVPVLRELYDRMKAAPAPVDLPDLWRRLGVVTRGAAVTFDDRAPLAAVRRAITAPAHPGPL